MPRGWMALILAAAAGIQLFTQPCGDLEWLALATRQMLHGAVPYRDILEPNPPLILWLYAAPVWLAERLNFNAILAIKGATLSMAFISVQLAARALHPARGWQEDAPRGAFVIGLLAVLTLTPDSFLTFGQREHWLVIFILPYVMASLPSQPVKPKAALGAMAALGFCLKPHFFLIWLAGLAVTRRVGPADAAIALVSLIYGATVALATPDYLPWLRLLAEIYPAYRFVGESAAQVGLWFAWIGLVGIGLALVFRPWRDHADGAYLLILSAAAYTQALIQYKSWGYIAYPYLALGMMAVMIPAIRRPMNGFGVFALFALLFFPIVPSADYRQENAQRIEARMAPLLRDIPSGSRVYLLSLLFPSTAFSKHPEFEWHARYPLLRFVLQDVLEPVEGSDYPSAHARPDKRDRQRRIFADIAGDLERIQPDALILFTHRDKERPGFDLAPWLRQDARLAGLMSRYRLHSRTNLCEEAAQVSCDYEIYLTPAARP